MIYYLEMVNMSDEEWTEMKHQLKKCVKVGIALVVITLVASLGADENATSSRVEVHSPMGTADEIQMAQAALYVAEGMNGLGFEAGIVSMIDRSKDVHLTAVWYKDAGITYVQITFPETGDSFEFTKTSIKKWTSELGYDFDYEFMSTNAGRQWLKSLQ